MIKRINSAGWIILLAPCGCATLTRGTTNLIQFTSGPPGAQEKTSIGHACTAPCTISIS